VPFFSGDTALDVHRRSVGVTDFGTREDVGIKRTVGKRGEDQLFDRKR
jgi:hypothetical protein